MSRIEKLLLRFRMRPAAVRYTDIEVLLLHLGCEKVGVKGGHVKCKHPRLRNDIIMPIHRNECKPFYKKQVLSQISPLLQKP